MIRGDSIMLPMINQSLLILVLILSVYFDIKEKRIPNVITFPIIIWGFISASFYSGLIGFQFSLLGFLCGFAVFFIPFAFRIMGGGDVKLMAAIGTLLGWKMVLLILLYTALAGGMIAIISAIYHHDLSKIILLGIRFVLRPFLALIQRKTLNRTLLNLLQKMDNIRISRESRYIPYAAAIAAGTLFVIYMPFPV